MGPSSPARTYRRWCSRTAQGSLHMARAPRSRMTVTDCMWRRARLTHAVCSAATRMREASSARSTVMTEGGRGRSCAWSPPSHRTVKSCGTTCGRCSLRTGALGEQVFRCRSTRVGTSARRGRRQGTCVSVAGLEPALESRIAFYSTNRAPRCSQLICSSKARLATAATASGHLLELRCSYRRTMRTIRTVWCSLAG